MTARRAAVQAAQSSQSDAVPAIASHDPLGQAHAAGSIDSIALRSTANERGAAEIGAAFIIMGLESARKTIVIDDARTLALENGVYGLR